MRPEAPVSRSRSGPRAAVVIASLVGVALFVYAVRAAGVQNVLAGIRKTGLGFAWVLLLSGVRYVLRCLAWQLCVEGPDRLAFRDALAAFLTGDAAGNLTFFGPVASEGTKAAVVRGRLPTMAALASIAVENIFYALGVATMIALGTIVFVESFPTSALTRTISLACAGAALTLALVTWLILYRSPRVLTRTVEWTLARVRIEALRSRIGSIRELEDRIHRFASRHPRRVPQVMLLELGFHLAAVAEVLVLLVLLVDGFGRSLVAQAIVLETVNRLITVAFKFVPMRVGIDEAGSGLATQVLLLSSGVGVTMAIVRKARTLVWSAVGLALLARNGLWRSP